jgi:uncharacterized protein (DUF4415 family)
MRRMPGQRTPGQESINRFGACSRPMSKTHNPADGPPIPPDRKPTARERRADIRFRYQLAQLEQDLRDIKTMENVVPPEWFKMDTLAPTRPRRKRITLLVDEEVVKWFKGLGEGYQGRVNAVLRAYMLGVMSKAFGGKFDRDKDGGLI